MKDAFTQQFQFDDYDYLLHYLRYVTLQVGLG